MSRRRAELEEVREVRARSGRESEANERGAWLTRSGWK
jgi:hypothetical protein